MRIRKNASKILGTASAFSSYSPPAATQIWSLPSHADTGPVCELNQSSWDVIDFLPSPALNHFRAGSPQVEKELEHVGNKGNGIKCEEKLTSSSITSTTILVAMEGVKEEGDMDSVERKENKVKKRKRNRKEKDGEDSKAAIGAAVTNTRCKKSDGKTWKCKRLAQHPHTLCEYHLSQLRSYNSNNKPSQKVQVPRAQAKKRRKAMVEEDSGLNFVYYYNGFGPWRGKRRGGVGGEGGSGEQEGDKRKQNSEFEDAYGAPAMEYDTREGRQDADDGQGGCHDAVGGGGIVEKDHGDDGDQMGEKESSNPYFEKRRRKRVKARSLKSIL